MRLARMNEINPVIANHKCSIPIIGLHHSPKGVTNLKYKLLSFLTHNKKISKRKVLAFNRDRCCHLALCLRLIIFHFVNS